MVQVSQTTTVEPKLVAGSEGTVVQVSVAAPVLNFESPDFTANLNQRSLQNIPINNRRWSALAMTTPGVVSDANGFGLVAIRGISPLLNNVMIDGADDNDAYFSEERGRTREGYSTSANAVQEFEVNTGVYSAQYGRAAGGVINSVTKSGTNQFHGQLYFYDRQSNWGSFQQQTLQTIPVFTPPNPIPTSFNVGVHIKPKDLRKIYGGTIQGPIFKDKVFFTYTYDQHTRIFPSIGAPNSPASFFTLPDAAATSPHHIQLWHRYPANGLHLQSGDRCGDAEHACGFAGGYAGRAGLPDWRHVKDWLLRCWATTGLYERHRRAVFS